MQDEARERDRAAREAPAGAGHRRDGARLLPHRPRRALPAQQDSFRWHIDLAKRTGKALQIHDRDAHEDVLRILREEGAPERTVLHCFSGDIAMARECVERGYHLSFSGTVTFKNAQGLRNALAVTPLGAGPRRDRRALPDAQPAPRGDQRAVPRAAHRPGDGRRPQRRRPQPLHAPSRPTRSASTAPGDRPSRLVETTEPGYAARRRFGAQRLTCATLRYQNLTFPRSVAQGGVQLAGDLEFLGRHAREGARQVRAPFPCVCPARSARIGATPWSIVISRPLRRIAQGAVLTAVVAGTLGAAHWNKSVTLSVDGASSSVGVFGGTVGDVLAKRGITLGPHDVVVPSAVRADRRRRQGRRAPRPAADGHRRRREEELLDHRDDGVLGAVRDGHPRRHGQAVRLPLADPRPAGPRGRRHHPQAGLGQGGRHDAAGPQHRPDRQGRPGRDEGQRRRQGPGPPGPDLRRRQARRGASPSPG